MPHRHIPKYRHLKARDLAFVEVHGRRIYLGKFGSAASKEKYAQIIHQLATDGEVLLRRSRNHEEETTTVVEICRDYWRHAKKRYANSPTRLDKTRRSLRWLRQTHGRTPVVAFGPACLAEHRQMVVHNAEGRLTRRYVNEHLQRIRRMFKWAASLELVDWDVYHKLTVLEPLEQGTAEVRESTDVAPVPDEIVQATLPHLPPIVADMVRIQRLTGMRPGEVCAMRPGDIDRGGDVWEYHPGDHKNAWRGHQRMVPLGPKAQAILRPYLLRPAETYCFSPAESERSRRQLAAAARQTPLSHGNRPDTNRKESPKREPGRCYKTSSYRRAVQRACRKAGVEPWSPNQLRHAAATEIRQRHGIEATGAVLGHEKLSTTEIYAQRNLELARSVARIVG